METRAHYVLIGAFVLSAVAAGFLFILWLGQTQREFDEYDIIFTERVSGLSVGAQVRFNGIQKGEVETLTIDPNDPSIVVARVRVDKDTPVKTDTKAELELVGFTGLAIIQFIGGSTTADLLKAVSEDRIPKISAEPSGIGQFLEGSGDVIAAANQLLSAENINGIAAIISNIETTTGAFAESEAELVAILENTEQLTADLASLASKLEVAASDAPETFEEINLMVTEARGLVEDLRAITDENRASIRVFADQGLGQVAPALAEARRLMRTLDYMLREIDRDPKAYFLGENAPEYGAEEE